MGRAYLPQEDADRFGCAVDLSGPPDALAALIGFETTRAADVVRHRPPAAAAARPAQPGLRGGHGRHLPPAPRPHRGRPGAGAAGPAVAARRRRSCGWRPGRCRWAGRDGARRRRRRRAWPAWPPPSTWPTPAPTWCSSSAGSRLGGLTSSFRRNGLWFDNGQHVFLRCCTAYRAFLDRIGATELFHLQDRLDVPVLAPGGVRVAAGPVAAAGAAAPRPVAGPLPPPPPDRAARRRPRRRWRCAASTPTIPALDAVTFGSWLADHGQSANAVDHLWELIARPDAQPDRRRGGPRPGRQGVPHRPARSGRRRRHRLGARPARRGPRRAAAAAALERAGVEIVTGAAVERHRPSATATRPAAATAPSPPTPSCWPRRTTSPPRCCRPAPSRRASTRTGSARRRCRRAPRARPAGHRPRRSPPSSTARCSSCSTAPSRPARRQRPGAGRVAVGRRERPGDPARGPRASRWSSALGEVLPAVRRRDRARQPSSPRSGRPRSGPCPAAPPTGRPPGPAIARALPGRGVDGHRLARHDGGCRAQRQAAAAALTADRSAARGAGRSGRLMARAPAALDRARTTILPALRRATARLSPELRARRRVPPRLDRRGRPAGRGRQRRQARAGGAGPAVGRRGRAPTSRWRCPVPSPSSWSTTSR